MEAIKNIKYLKLFKKVITIPSGYDTLREHGNWFIDDNRFIFTSTATKKVDGKIEYSTHYWTSPNRYDWQYKGKLNLPFQSEDLHLSKEGNRYIAMYENKSSEKKGRFIISYAISDSIDGKFLHYPNFGYEPSMTGINGCLAVYSPLRRNALIALLDWRTDDSELNIENIGLAKWQGNNWGKIRTLMKPNNYGYDTLGVGGDIHKIGNEYVLELAGGINYTPPPNKYIKWVNGLVLLDSNFNVKKMLNKILKDKDGNAVWATFANAGNWFALSRKRGTNDIYLAELITKDGSTPSNGGDMKPVITLKDDKLTCEPYPNAADYFWHSSKELDDKGNPYFGRGLSIDIPERLQVDGNEFWIYCKLQDKSNSPDSEKVIYKSGTVEPDPKPTNNTEVIARMQDRINKMAAELSSLDDDLKLIKPQ